MQEIVLPELVAELDDALVLIISSVSECLADLFERIYRGEKIDYKFNWNLIKREEIEYVVGLLVKWGPEEGFINIGFPRELWEFLGVIKERRQLVLMTDWRVFEEGLAFDGEIQDIIIPKALVINEADAGMDFLSKQVLDEALVLREPKEELYDLLDILRPVGTPDLLN